MFTVQNVFEFLKFLGIFLRFLLLFRFFWNLCFFFQKIFCSQASNQQWVQTLDKITEAK